MPGSFAWRISKPVDWLSAFQVSVAESAPLRDRPRLDGVEGRNNDLLNPAPPLNLVVPPIKRENYRFSSFYTVLRNGQLMPAERLVPELFQANENLYGTYAVMAGHNDGYLYLFARSGAGIGPSAIKVARVPQASLTDKSKYEYWDGASWSATQPSTADTKSNIISAGGFMDTGEIFWSNHFGCYVHVSASYGGFNVAYSDSLTSGWSQPQSLYEAQIPDSIKSGSSSNIIYAGHSYPDWDPSGKSLLLSWTCDEMWTQMAVVEFA